MYNKGKLHFFTIKYHPNYTELPKLSKNTIDPSPPLQSCNFISSMSPLSFVLVLNLTEFCIKRPIYLSVQNM